MNNLSQQNNQTKMQQTVLQRLSLLKTMDMAAVHEKWVELFGTEPPKYKKHFLVRRLAWRIQEMYLGGLSERSKSALEQLAASDPVARVGEAIPAQPKPKVMTVPGTRFVRVWKGERHEVEAQEQGFAFQGITYRSLSAVAYAITGTKWNGNVFFGLKKAGGANGK